MTRLSEFLAAEGTMSFVLRSTLAATLILTLGLLFTLPLRRHPAARAAALLATLLGVLLSPVAAWFASTGSLTVLEVSMPAPIAPVEIMTQHRPLATATERSGAATDTVAVVVTEESSDSYGESIAMRHAASHESPLANGASTYDVDWKRIAGAIWLLGVMIGLARLLAGRLRLSRMLHSSRPLGDDAIHLPLAEACRLFGTDRPPRILVNEAIATPFVHGLRRPTIHWPIAMLTSIPRERRLEILLHEWAHVARRDTVSGLLQRLVTALYWPHPLIHWLDHSLAIAREEACDNWVLGATSPTTYARTLIDLGSIATDAETPASAFGLFPERWHLEDRIKGLLDRRRSRARSARRAPTTLFGAVLAAALLLATGTAFVTAHLAAPRIVEPPIVLRGRITGEADAPLSGARIQATFYGRRGIVVAARADSDANGAFELSIDLAVAEGRVFRDKILQSTDLLVAADGYLPGFVAGRFIGDVDHVDFELRRDDGIALRGRIVDTEGLPRARCRVRVLALHAPNDLRAGIRNDGETSVTLAGNDTPMGGPFLTDSDGWFTIPGIGQDRRVALAVEAPNVERRPFWVTIAPDAPQPERIGFYRLFTREEQDTYGLSFEHYGPTFTHIVPKSRPIRGRVVDAGSRAPVPGVTIKAHAGNASEDQLIVETDADGRYVLHGVAESLPFLQISAIPEYASPWLECSGTFYEAPFEDIADLSIELHRGVPIRGRVTERGTDHGVAAQLEFSPMPDNDSSKFMSIERSEDSFGAAMSFVTDPDGRFEFLGLPGRCCIVTTTRNDIYGTEDPARFEDWLDEYGHLMTQRLRIDVRRSHAVNIFEVPDASAGTEVAIAVRTGARMSLTLKDEVENDLDGVLVAGQAPLTYGFIEMVEPTFDVVGLKKGEFRQVVLRDPARRLGAWTTVSYPSESRTHRTVKLSPCGIIMGRVVKPDGAPASFLDLYILIERIGANGAIDLLLQEIVRTDAGGWFTFDAVPEATYNILDYRTIVRSGETVDIGAVTLLDRMRR